LFSGIRSEYNQAYYSNLAAHVIVKGIEARQELVYRRIQIEGQRKNIDDYPLEAAVKDAVFMDGLCSVVTGLDQAAASVDATNEPGLDAATRTLLRARLAKEALDLPRDQLLKPEMLESIGLAGARLGMSLVGSVRGEPLVADADTDLFVTASKIVERVDGVVAEVAQEVEHAVNSRRQTLLGKLAPTDAPAAKPGALADAVKAALKEKIVAPLRLDACYSKVAAPAVEKRLAAIKKRDNATNDEQKAVADFEVTEAAREIQSARDQLLKKERLVNLDLDAYRKQRLKAVNAIDDPKQLADPKALVSEPELAASKLQGCG